MSAVADHGGCSLREVPAHRHMHPTEVGLPTTQDEADAALSVCEANIKSLESFIEYTATNGFSDSAARGRLLKWQQRCAEIRYVVTRMNAGLPAIEPPPVNHADVLAQLVDARARIAELEKRASMAPRPGLLAELERQKAERATDLAKIKDALRKLHEVNARTTYALRGMVLAGVPLTPTAAQALYTCSRAMPVGFFDAWRAEQCAAFVEASKQHAARNGASIEEPCGEQSSAGRMSAIDAVIAAEVSRG